MARYFQVKCRLAESPRFTVLSASKVYPRTLTHYVGWTEEGHKLAYTTFASQKLVTGLLAAYVAVQLSSLISAIVLGLTVAAQR
jgi:uncharacterized membrane protein required for colicin V production